MLWVNILLVLLPLVTNNVQAADSYFGNRSWNLRRPIAVDSRPHPVVNPIHSIPKPLPQPIEVGDYTAAPETTERTENYRLLPQRAPLQRLPTRQPAPAIIVTEPTQSLHTNPPEVPASDDIEVIRPEPSYRRHILPMLPRPLLKPGHIELINVHNEDPSTVPVIENTSELNSDATTLLMVNDPTPEPPVVVVIPETQPTSASPAEIELIETATEEEQEQPNIIPEKVGIAPTPEPSAPGPRLVDPRPTGPLGPMRRPLPGNHRYGVPKPLISLPKPSESPAEVELVPQPSNPEIEIPNNEEPAQLNIIPDKVEIAPTPEPSAPGLRLVDPRPTGPLGPMRRPLPGNHRYGVPKPLISPPKPSESPAEVELVPHPSNPEIEPNNEEPAQLNIIPDKVEIAPTPEPSAPGLRLVGPRPTGPLGPLRRPLPGNHRYGVPKPLISPPKPSESPAEVELVPQPSNPEIELPNNEAPTTVISTPRPSESPAEVELVPQPKNPEIELPTNIPEEEQEQTEDESDNIVLEKVAPTTEAPASTSAPIYKRVRIPRPVAPPSPVRRPLPGSYPNEVPKPVLSSPRPIIPNVITTHRPIISTTSNFKVNPNYKTIPESVWTTPAPVELQDYRCKESEAYYSISGDCDNYVECRKYTAIMYSCPDGLHYNPKARWPEYPCAYPSEVKCESNALRQLAHPTDECPQQYGFYPIDSECSRYIMCQEGIAFIMHCPPGLAFNSVSSSCDWPENVPSCNPDVFHGFTCPAPPLEEDGTPSEFIFKYRYKESCKEYIACQRGHPRLLRCDDGLSFDEESEVCVDSDYVSNCRL